MQQGIILPTPPCSMDSEHSRLVRMAKKKKVMCAALPQRACTTCSMHKTTMSKER